MTDHQDALIEYCCQTVIQHPDISFKIFSVDRVLYLTWCVCVCGEKQDTNSKM